MMRIAMMALVMAFVGSSPPVSGQTPQWVEGTHYFVIQPARPTGLPAGKVEVTEIFSYACPGCNRFYPTVDRLAASLPSNAVLDYLPAGFRPDEDWTVFQRGYLVAKKLGVDLRTHDAMFDAVWKTGELAVYDQKLQRAKRPAPMITDLARFYERTAGIKPDTFLSTSGSFEIDVNVRKTDELIASYGVGETPSIVVNGKYRLNPVSAGGDAETVALVKWLVERESTGAH